MPNFFLKPLTFNMKIGADIVILSFKNVIVQILLNMTVYMYGLETL